MVAYYDARPGIAEVVFARGRFDMEHDAGGVAHCECEGAGGEMLG